MKKFMVFYHAPKSAMEMMASASPEEMKKAMEPWMEWAKKCGDKLVDLGTPLGNSQRVTKSTSSESSSTLNGYSVLQASDIDEAVSLVKDHPHLSWVEGAEIEVFEALPVPGME